jgi:hypothetical protein
LKVVVATILMLALALTMVSAAAPKPGVRPGDWDYEAVRVLANKGLVSGYKDANFLGDRSLTRYEMAALVSRVLDKVELAQGDGDSSEPADTDTETPAAPPAVTTPIAPIATADLATIQKLVEDYKVELTVIGADLAKVQTKLEGLQGDVDTIKETLNDAEGPFQTVLNNVSALQKIKLSGYVQARYEADQSATNGSTKNTFRVRRARLKLTATPTSRTELVIQPDFTQSVTLKEASAGYIFGENTSLAPTLRVGQVLWPFGYENVISSSLLDTPERTSVITTLLPGEYDMGATVTSKTMGRLTWTTGLFNGTGANTLDNNKRKDFVGRIRLAATKQLDLGASWYVGKQFNPAIAATSSLSAVAASSTDKNRYGFDFQYYLDKITIKGEYVAGKQYQYKQNTPPTASLTDTPTVNGAYLLASMNVAPKLAAVVKYSYYNPNFAGDKYGKLTTWDLGFNKYLDSQTKLRLFYQINDEQRAAFKNNVIRAEILTIF